MRVSVQLISVFVTSLLSASYTYAYGPLGHEIVGQIAEGHLCRRAAGEVRQLLEGESLGRAARWPDWIRKEPKWSKSRPWHFINVADDERLEDITGSEKGDVIWAIGKFRVELADPNLSQQRRAEALRFLAHFIADVHQPLHVGRAEDRGGNEIEVLVDGHETNLHNLWDAQWLLTQDRKNNGTTVAGQVASIDALVAGRVDLLQSTGPLDWAHESKALRSRVYAFESVDPGRPVELDQPYLAAVLRITRERLAVAGVRLAGTLNVIFCSSASTP